MAPALPQILPPGDHRPDRAAWEPRSTGPAILVLHSSGLEDGTAAITAVRAGRSVVLDASGLERALGQRLVDFTCGGVTAMDGHAHRLGDAIFLFTPALTRVETDAQED